MQEKQSYLPLALRIRRECRNYLVKTPSDARTVLSTFPAISQVASVQLPSVWRTQDFRKQPIPFRQLKVFKSSSLYGGKIGFPATSTHWSWFAIEGHTKQVCIKHRTSNNCAVPTTEYSSIQRRETKMTPELLIQWPKRMMTL